MRIHIISQLVTGIQRRGFQEKLQDDEKLTSEIRSVFMIISMMPLQGSTATEMNLPDLRVKELGTIHRFTSIRRRKLKLSEAMMT